MGEGAGLRPGVVQQALGERGAAAAAAALRADLPAAALQQLDRGAADARFGGGGERVGEDGELALGRGL
ncbi:hypothetical protein GCM10010357_17590 [Streptomyces luteireticuli]|uniref:Uncharacterized protein n=1 Tax=Streptomyces luteireticuli TaxID=173858 RepID=A0ABN0YIY6_9ACTN